MRIAVYVRVSTQHQAQTQTIDQQLERLRAHCQSQNWELPDENIFRDDGYSGAALNRPGLDRLRDKVKAAEVDRILITTRDSASVFIGKYNAMRLKAGELPSSNQVGS